MNEVKQLKDLIQLPVRVQNSRYIFDQNGYIAEIITPEIATAICNELNRGVEVDVEKAAEEYAKSELPNSNLSVTHSNKVIRTMLEKAVIFGSSLPRNGWISVSIDELLLEYSKSLKLELNEVDILIPFKDWLKNKLSSQLLPSIPQPNNL